MKGHSRKGKDVTSDIFIIGGGINGCGIARDAAGEDVAGLFCDTVQEKLTDCPDNTIFMSDGYYDT